MMNREDRKELIEGLTETFDVSGFEKLLSQRFDTRLDRITARSAPMTHIIQNVLIVAERAGWTRDLVEAAYEERPQNQKLASSYEKLGLAPVVSIQDGGSGALKVDGASSEDGLERGRVDSQFLGLARWRDKLVKVEARTCRVELGGWAVATGFLVGPDTLLTCYHVLERVIRRQENASDVRFRFDYKALPDGSQSAGLVVSPALDWLVDASPYAPTEGKSQPESSLPGADELDHALIRLDHPVGSRPITRESSGGSPRGWIRVPDSDPEAGSTLLIVQSTIGGHLKVFVDAVGTSRSNEQRTRLRYATNTEAGSSGAPVFNEDWTLIAMHQLGDPGFGQAAFNQGIPIGAIRERLERVGKLEALGGDPP
jgi:hypothetical protein